MKDENPDDTSKKKDNTTEDNAVAAGVLQKFNNTMKYIICSAMADPEKIENALSMYIEVSLHIHFNQINDPEKTISFR